jgi:hypothetical protein
MMGIHPLEAIVMAFGQAFGVIMWIEFAIFYIAFFWPSVLLFTFLQSPNGKIGGQLLGTMILGVLILFPASNRCRWRHRVSIFTIMMWLAIGVWKFYQTLPELLD